MKPIETFEEKSDEETAWPPIPQVISSTSSHASSILSEKGTAMNASSNAHGAQAPNGGKPPLPLHLQSDEQERDDIPRPPVLGRRDQSTGTAMSGLTENSPAESPARAGHDRKISWGAVLDHLPSPLQQRKEEPVVSDKVLSVQDLHAAGPLEAEAETSILKAIEERGEDPSTIGNNILTGVPASAAESFRVRKEARTMSPPGHRRISTAGTRKKVDLESTLLDLTNAMRDLNEDSAVIPEREQDHGASLINDANILFRRSSTKKDKSTRNLISSASENKDFDPELGEGDIFSDDVDKSEDKNDKQQRRCGPLSSCMKRVLCVKAVEEDWSTFSDFVRPRRASMILQLKSILLAFILPALVVAILLFYGFGNPELGRHDATWSWFLLFLIRHSILYILARATMCLCIDLLSLNTMWTVRVMGPFPSLCLVQSRGFPFIVSVWAFYGINTLSGGNRFARHWLFYQDAIALCNESNPSGTVTESAMNYAVLCCALFFGIAVTLKRVILGLHFGRKTYSHYGEDVAKLVRKIILVGEVAALAKDLERGKSLEHIQVRAAVLAFNIGDRDDARRPGGSNDDSEAGVSSGMTYSEIIDNARRDRYTGSLTDSQRNELMGLLESWEEPETEKRAKTDDVSISAILQFRAALTMTYHDCPFSPAFGLADTREHCIESSQIVYKRLLQRQGDSDAVLDFDTIALLATTEDGDIDKDKMKELIRLFRPERDGTLTMVDFVKSVDAVYKRLRLLSASIENAGQIDHAAEQILNWIFYTIVAIIIVTILGFDPLAMFLSLSSIIVGFAFMIGNASSRYFEGILFVLARRPYGIGDRIHVSPIDEDTSPNGSSTWFVENVSLFSTTIRFATTNEVATVSNGSLANSRVINAARSPKMLVYVYMKFGVDVPYRKVKLFRKTVEEFVKQRPRDWLSMCGFRATRVEQELGYIEYVMVLQHRERWQNIVPMLNAKAEFSSFALEVAKKLKMPYRAPSLPVDLNMGNAALTRLNEAANAEGNLEEMKRRGSTRTAPDMSELATLFTAASVSESDSGW